MKTTKRVRKPAAAKKQDVEAAKRKPGIEYAREQAAAAAAKEPAPEAATPTPEADAKIKTYRLNMNVRIDQATEPPAPCVETDLRSYINFLERKYGLTIHAIDYQKRPAGEYVKAVTTMGPEKHAPGTDWFALAS